MSDLALKANDYVVQTRSAYQIERFVINSHDTAPMRYRQILIEAQDLAYKIAKAEVSERRIMRRIEALQESNAPNTDLDLQDAQIDLAQTRLALEGARRELAVLERLFAQYRHYTPEEIESDQPEYWALRLNRQADLDRASIEQGVSTGNLQSMLSAGLLEHRREIEA